ncbi:MAG: DUF2339 domain-containing protein [Pseudomonadota bacterium]
MEGLLVLIVLAIFVGPYVAVALVWGKANRLERQLGDTISWANSQLNSIRAERLVEEPDPEERERPRAEASDQGQAFEDERSASEPELESQEAITPNQDPVPAAEEFDDAKANPEPATMAYATQEETTYADSEPDLELDTEPSQGFKFDFEDIFGRRLPIWAGGIALAIAGIFLVRYAIEAGLVTPTIRVLLSFLFGLGLIAGAEAAYRYEEKIRDERVRQALAGAGIATLYGAFYLAGTAYGLIGAGAAFIGLAIVTAGAIALSFRFGLPCAILGLVGGFAAPMMVNSESANVPVLALYLALVTGGLAWTGHKQGNRWLGYAALAIGLGWGVLMQLSGLGSSTDLLAVGGYLIILGTVLPAFLHDRQGPSLLQMAAAGIATLQMAALVDSAGFTPLTWGLYLLISAALAFLGWRFSALRPASGVAALIGVWLLALWPDPDSTYFVAVSAALAVIFAGMPLFHQLRGRANLIDIVQLAAVPVGIGAFATGQLTVAQTLLRDAPLAFGLAILALFPVAGFWLRWRQEEGLQPKFALSLLGSAYVLTFGALLLVTPDWTAPISAALLGLMLIGLLWKRQEESLLIAAWGGAAAALLSLVVTPAFESELLMLGNEGEVEHAMRAAARWLAALLPFLAMSMLQLSDRSRWVSDGFAAAFAYGIIAQIVPGESLAWLAALAALGFFVWRVERIAAWAVFLVIAAFWSLLPVGLWLAAAISALIGEPFLSRGAVSYTDIALRLVPLMAVSAFIVWRGTALPNQVRSAIGIVAVIFGLVMIHSIYKQAWDISSLLRFEWYGMGERSVWQSLLFLGGLAASQLVPARIGKPASLALFGAALLHFVWFTLVLHNPLVMAQHVGPTPIANWLLLAYGIAIASLVFLRSDIDGLFPRTRQAVDVAIMVLVVLLAASLLRQVFSGSLLTTSIIDQTESLLLSLLGIALALGYLWWGSFRQERSWRIGSLVLMLLAVLKVFLIDAAGLEGLLRIASFMALGFSLIGIGWVYSRQLARRTSQ